MPTYDYVCDACQHEFELFQPITADPERRCPKCKKLKLRRLFGTGAGIIFKGSGFYTTDYRSDSYQKAAKADKSSSESSDKKESSGESKPADKPAAEKKPAESKPSESRTGESKQGKRKKKGSDG